MLKLLVLPMMHDYIQRYVEDCDSLQSDLKCVYDWAKTNMVLTPKNLNIYIFL